MSLFYKTESDTKENLRVDSGTEDELSAPSKLCRVTPRNSIAGQASPTGRDPTPYTNVSNPGLDGGAYANKAFIQVTTPSWTNKKAIYASETCF